MTNKQLTYKKSLIQKIQIVKHNVFFDDESRREFMLSRFGVDSTTKLNIDELKLLLKYCLKEIGDIPVFLASEAQLHKINTLWLEKSREKSIASLSKFASKIAKRDVNFINELRKDEATKVIVALERLKSVKRLD